VVFYDPGTIVATCKIQDYGVDDLKTDAIPTVTHRRVAFFSYGGGSGGSFSTATATRLAAKKIPLSDSRRPSTLWVLGKGRKAVDKIMHTPLTLSLRCV